MFYSDALNRPICAWALLELLYYEDGGIELLRCRLPFTSQLGAIFNHTRDFGSTAPRGINLADIDILDVIISMTYVTEILSFLIKITAFSDMTLSCL